MMKAMQHYTIYHQSEGVYAQIIVKKGRMQVPSWYESDVENLGVYRFINLSLQRCL